MFAWLKNLFSNNGSELVKNHVEVDKEPETELNKSQDLKLWVQKALETSASFESDDGLPQVTGDFDGCGLTCGYLGWTMKWKNQTNIIFAYIRKHGEEKANILMPKTWSEYKKVIYMRTDSEMIRAVKHWSSGANVKEPYKSELQAFWRSQEMIELQIEFAAKEQGKFALKKANETKDFLGLDKPSLMHFCFWFDWCVLNGAGKIPDFKASLDESYEDSITWSPFGYGYKDIKKNNEIWLRISERADQRFLMKMAKLRAKTSRPQFRPVVMNRRGTVVFGEGFVNGKLRKLTF